MALLLLGACPCLLSIFLIYHASWTNWCTRAQDICTALHVTEQIQNPANPNPVVVCILNEILNDKYDKFVKVKNRKSLLVKVV